jgi:hypothetical protein
VTPEDAQAAQQRAEEAARAARAVEQHPGLQAAFARLEALYTHQFKTSEPKDTETRESAYYLLRALDALRQDISAAAQGAEVSRHNLKRRLHTKP